MLDERKSETVHWNTRCWMNENLKLYTEIHDVGWTKIWNCTLKYTMLDERKSETVHWNTRCWMNENLKLYTEIHDVELMKIWNCTLKNMNLKCFCFYWEINMKWRKKKSTQVNVKVCINVMYQCGYRKMSCLSMKIRQMTYILNSALNA
jgi:hypothetical protein